MRQPQGEIYGKCILWTIFGSNTNASDADASNADASDADASNADDANADVPNVPNANDANADVPNAGDVSYVRYGCKTRNTGMVSNMAWMVSVVENGAHTLEKV